MDDHRTILSEVLGSGDVDVYELESQPNNNVRIFSAVEDILAEFDIPYPGGIPRSGIHLNLWVKGSGSEPDIGRTPMNSSRNNGVLWKERTGSLGFVTFYLERPVEGMLRHSQTNTVSEARIGAEDGIVTDHRGNCWNVRLTNRYSAKLNRIIRKQAVAKIGAMSVLPGAARFWHDGGNFDGHYSNTKNASYYVRVA
ncbi:hypothetical protein AB838_16775 [Rhodobacteraceae bacterium (ex Bugula neritina AB1)]|nr:hypothetical protein AB838_16775 [Rhodobacteraceae bacterium (ex Bugula neritina AB1)]